MQNFGDYTFSNKDDILNPDSRKYVMYNEGIYVGYRYYETRYEDYVLNRGNANSSAGSYVDATWNYAKEVQFPFGYGLSYANLSQELISSNVDWNTKKATFTVKVINESSLTTTSGFARISSHANNDRATKDKLKIFVTFFILSSSYF